VLICKKIFEKILDIWCIKTKCPSGVVAYTCRFCNGSYTWIYEDFKHKDDCVVSMIKKYQGLQTD
jgi:hypothetical protein